MLRCSNPTRIPREYVTAFVPSLVQLTEGTERNIALCVSWVCVMAKCDKFSGSFKSVPVERALVWDLKNFLVLYKS